jgi:hypothetical protein
MITTITSNIYMQHHFKQNPTSSGTEVRENWVFSATIQVKEEIISFS